MRITLHRGCRGAATLLVLFGLSAQASACTPFPSVSPEPGTAKVCQPAGGRPARSEPSTLAFPVQLVLKLDRQLGRRIEQPEPSRGRRLARLAGRLGEPQILLMGLAALYLTGNRSDRRAALDSLGVGVQVSITSRLAKILFGRDRPRRGNGRFHGPTLLADSFPSGHTALAFGVAAAYGRRRPAAAGVAYSLAGLVGWSRVAEGAHWPGDVAAGAALGLTLGRR